MLCQMEDLDGLFGRTTNELSWLDAVALRPEQAVQMFCRWLEDAQGPPAIETRLRRLDSLTLLDMTWAAEQLNVAWTCLSFLM